LRQRLESARRRDGHTQEDEDVLDAAIEETDAILQTFGALLSIAEIEAGARKQRFAAVSLSDTVRNLVEVYETVAEDNGQTLTAEIRTEMTCRGDRDLLVQMLANLVENAITHTPAGSRIAVTLSRVPGGSLLAVADDGPGIPPEDRDKVFRRFYRSEQSRTTPGTGLGLALVKAVIDLHDGSIAILDNAPGLRVEIHFPCEGA
jgi:signal transduction histidine kinase